MPRTNSLAFRLVAIAAIWIIAGLIVGGVLLSSLFRTSAVRSFDTRLAGDLENVISVVEPGADGKLKMVQPFVDQRFQIPLSGWYWQVSTMAAGAAAKAPLLRSPSLWKSTLETGAVGAVGETRTGYIVGPRQKRLRFLERVIEFSPPDSEDATAAQETTQYRFAVAGDVKDVEGDIERFDETLLWSMAILGAGLILGMIAQVRWGLLPLNVVSRSLAAIREGRADRLEGQFPAEIEPLANELNALVEHNAEVVARARTHVGNLAHFLKTPLSVLANEAQGAKGALAETVARQVHVMRRQVDHYLARARSVGSATILGARTEAAPVVGDLTRALTKIYAGRGIAIQRKCPEGLSFRGDRADLEEMIGNLLDNACKWASAKVTITVTAEGAGRMRVVVADDGPGLDDEQKLRVLERGERLDESKPGSGLGLGIVKEIASLYGGKLELGRAASGGLAAQLTLPAAG